jgi:predicted transcriptional regulator
MLIVETIGRIRREHLVKGKSIKEIARDLKISRNTVRNILRLGETSFSYEREVQSRPRLGRWKAELDRMLTANADNTARERLTNTYFEGATAGNPKAGRGRSKEKRSD